MHRRAGPAHAPNDAICDAVVSLFIHRESNQNEMESIMMAGSGPIGVDYMPFD